MRMKEAVKKRSRERKAAFYILTARDICSTLDILS